MKQKWWILLTLLLCGCGASSQPDQTGAVQNDRPRLSASTEETAENMVIQMESLEAELPERLTSESEELVPEYKKNPEMEMPTVEINGQECIPEQVPHFLK